MNPGVKSYASDINDPNKEQRYYPMRLFKVISIKKREIPHSQKLRNTFLSYKPFSWAKIGVDIRFVFFYNNAKLAKGFYWGISQMSQVQRNRTEYLNELAGESRRCRSISRSVRNAARCSDLAFSFFVFTSEGYFCPCLLT